MPQVGKKERNNKKSAIIFLKRYWSIILLVFLLIGIVYLPKLINYNYSIDTERMIRFPDYTLNWWLRLGRYGLVALTKLPIFGGGTNINYINFLTYVLLFFSAVILMYIFDKEADHTKIEQFLAVGLYVTTPIILEQTNFVLQSAPVVFASITMLIGYGLLRRYLETKQIRYLVLGVALETFSFSVYVSLIIGFIGLAIVELCYSSKKNLWSFKKYFSTASYMAVISVISYGLYLLGNKLSFRIFSLKKTDYLAESRLWGNIPNDQVLATIKNSIQHNFNFESPFVMWGFILLLLLFVITSILNKDNLAITLITVISLLIVGTYTVPLFGYLGTLRSYFPVYPIIMYGLALNSFEVKKYKIFEFIICLLIFLIVGIQSYNTFQLGENEAHIYDQEIELVNDIQKDLTKNNVTDYKKYKLVLIGGRTFDEITHGDMLGNSVFNWDLSSNVGVSYRAGDFMYNHGLKFKRPTPEEFSKSFSIAQKMRTYPQEGGIKVVNDLVIIRLS
ncbi:glucosyltransferase domain-containing protein [Enterococcus raffinosus]|uniref:glucosyltransferase domain-containing protein n=1 Tax=Enterococcus raffinosus TaxID=71452 RepID=UPI002891BDE9|nr:glucosyltransferase domain-containing protein [Enterococcus raffinosus]MDT2525124.1 glucosyltransferase domain-containing protein [Enterococcus raffinosus]MDT2592479.1 glucosyltransferase domain-containing protein [Enterococcus raffinosus]